MSSDQSREYIIANGQEFEVGERGLSIEPYMGREDHPLGGWLHGLSFYAEPVDDQFPHLLFTDVELYKRGRMPKVLNGVRIRQNLDEGDYDLPWITIGRWLMKRPWIRPGSTMGMVSVVFEPPSLMNTPGQGDASKRLFVHDDLKIAIDRISEELWRVEIEVHYEAQSGPVGPGGGYAPLPDGIPAGVFKAAFNCPLEIIMYDD